METALACQTLRLFNEKADKLQRLSFAKKILHGEIAVNISWKRGAKTKIKRFGPSEESIEAFVLTFRFFIQENEPTSFAKIGKLYNDFPVGSDLVRKFNDEMKLLKRIWKSKAHVNIGEQQLTRRQVFEVFMWGGLAHSQKKSTYDEWAKDSLIFPLLQSEFIMTLAKILEVIFEVRNINQAVIREIERVA